jgi:hypothetical protein
LGYEGKKRRERGGDFNIKKAKKANAFFFPGTYFFSPLLLSSRFSHKKDMT